MNGMGQSMTPGGYQPYARQGGQMPGPALTAMKHGAPFFLPNPMDQQRQMQKQVPAAVTLLDLLRR